MSSGLRAILATGKRTDEGLQISKGLSRIAIYLQASCSEEIGAGEFGNREGERGVTYGLFVILQIGKGQSAQIVEIEEVILTLVDGRLELPCCGCPLSPPCCSYSSVIEDICRVVTGTASEAISTDCE